LRIEAGASVIWAMSVPVAHISAFTHRGRVRARNEDAIVVGDWVSPPEMQSPHSIRCGLARPLVCAVADGMGGHRAGEVASRHAVRQLAAAGERLSSAGRVAECLTSINDRLYQAMARDPSLEGMGTTVAGLVLGEPAIWFNVGDSRVYRFRDGRLSQLSIDDVPPGPRFGYITQSLGGVVPALPVAPHVGEKPLSPPARFLLCSDGLTDMLGDDEIADCMALPDADAVTQLFELAMDAGGADNVSIVFVRVEEGP
jgi:serine/threonine protein phosphatase PrpC